MWQFRHRGLVSTEATSRKADTAAVLSAVFSAAPALESAFNLDASSKPTTVTAAAAIALGIRARLICAWPAARLGEWRSESAGTCRSDRCCPTSHRRCQHRWALD